jgi:hypothetical protein
MRFRPIAMPGPTRKKQQRHSLALQLQFLNHARGLCFRLIFRKQNQVVHLFSQLDLRVLEIFGSVDTDFWLPGVRTHKVLENAGLLSRSPEAATAAGCSGLPLRHRLRLSMFLTSEAESLGLPEERQLRK